MRRADRLFEIIQIMRRKRLTRAADLAEELEVSERTVYRDIRDLMSSGVPIDGEAGVGYVLREGYDLPPLMFKESEIEALVLGAHIVESWADPDLAKAASDIIAKVQQVLPDHLRRYMANTALLAPEHTYMEPLSFALPDLRAAVRDKRKVHFAYRDAIGGSTARTVRPLSLAFFGPVWLLASWCELRTDFRAFRLDRIADFSVRDETFNDEPGKTLHEFLKRDRAWQRGAAHEAG
jgi:predicted DNA-binding transcriptional regulator YafY